MAAKKIPYFPQIMSPELVHAFIFEGFDPVRDARWREFGTDDPAEYARLWKHVCGMACLKMILAARGIEKSIYGLLRECMAYGGYVEEEDGNIRGLIYRPFVKYVAATYGVDAEVKENWPVSELAQCLRRNPGFCCIASVHPSIRFNAEDPPKKGGHLVLAHGSDGKNLVFHNPSGTTLQNQQNARLNLADFDRYYAGRGILIK